MYMLRNRTDQELEFVIVIIFSFGIYINPFECPLSLSLYLFHFQRHVWVCNHAKDQLSVLYNEF